MLASLCSTQMARDFTPLIQNACIEIENVVTEANSLTCVYMFNPKSYSIHA